MEEHTEDWIARLRDTATNAAEQWQEQHDRAALLHHSGIIVQVLPADGYMAVSTLMLVLSSVINGIHHHHPGRDMGPRLYGVVKDLIAVYERELPPDAPT